jgi:hypothetical protein
MVADVRPVLGEQSGVESDTPGPPLGVTPHEVRRNSPTVHRGQLLQ